MLKFILLSIVFGLVYKVTDKPTTQKPLLFNQKLSDLKQGSSDLKYQVYTTFDDDQELQVDHYIHYDDFESFDLSATSPLVKNVTGDIIVIPRNIKRDALDCPTQEECIKTTGNCSNHGSCTKQPHPRKPKTQCFYCSCTLKKMTNDKGEVMKNYPGFVSWTGSSCQYQDISASFHIVFWTVVALIFALM
jgi:hypothetical protein